MPALIMVNIDNDVDIDGMKAVAQISAATADRISRKLDIAVHRGYRSKREILVAGKESSFKRSGNYKCFFVEIERDGYEYSLMFRGSLHKYHKGNNTGGLSGYEIIEAKKSLCHYFEINENDCKLLTLEIGINISVWFEPYEYLKNNLIQHKKKRFDAMTGYPKRIGFTATHDDYTIKLYRKLNNMLRYEIKLKSKKKINEFGIFSLNDINETNINLLADYLLEQWNEVITRDGLNIYDRDNRIDLLNKKQREKILEFTSLVFCQSYTEKLRLAKSKTQADKLRQEAYRLKKCCIEIIKKHGNGDHVKIYELIQSGVKKFKMSWNKPMGGKQINQGLVNSGKRDNSIIDNNKEKQIAYKINNMNTTESKKGNNKQGAMAKRKEREIKINLFMDKLKITLDTIEGKKVPVQQKVAA